MKAILIWLVIMLLGTAELGSLTAGDMDGPFDRYILNNNTAIEIESDPPPDLVVNDETPKWISKVFEVEEVWPGDSGEATLKLQNIGDLGTLYLHLLNLMDEPGITPEPEPTPDSGELSQNLDMLVWWDDNNNGIYDAGEGPPIAEDTLENIACNIYDLGTLDYMEIRYLGIAWTVDSAVGNEIMGDKCSFDIQFVLD
jgi:hypothetical protein